MTAPGPGQPVTVGAIQSFTTASPVRMDELKEP